jgi:hypothetical protein
VSCPIALQIRTVIASPLSGQYERRLKIIAFDTQEGWVRDVTAEIAAEIRGRICDGDELTPALRAVLDRAVPPRPRPASSATPAWDRRCRKSGREDLAEMVVAAGSGAEVDPLRDHGLRQAHRWASLLTVQRSPPICHTLLAASGGNGPDKLRSSG